MRVAGVRLSHGAVLWVDAGTLDVSPLDRAVVQGPDGLVEGEIFLAPEQVIEGAPPIAGILLRSTGAVTLQESAGPLPGEDMPPLGTTLFGGLVVRVDAVNRMVTLRLPSGNETTVPMETREA